MRFESIPGCIDGARININSVVVKFQEYFRDVAIRAAEVQQPARRPEDRSVQLALEVGTAQNVLDQIPQRLTYRRIHRRFHNETTWTRSYPTRFSTVRAVRYAN